MRAFVTVGSTRFDALVDAILEPECLQELARKGIHELEIQSGETVRPAPRNANGIIVHRWSFKASLEEDLKRADLVISHAGTGTILEVLRLAKPLIVVPNPSLLHNHQQELGVALDNLGHLRCTDLRSLASTIQNLDMITFVPLPAAGGNSFSTLIDEEMGYI